MKAEVISAAGHLPWRWIHVALRHRRVTRRLSSFEAFA